MGNTCSHHLPIISNSIRGSKDRSRMESPPAELGMKDSSRMESLPAELLMNILSRVPTLDLLQLSFVCRRWRNIFKDPLFRRFHYTQSMSNPNENQVVLLKTELKLHLVDLAKEKSKGPREIVADLPGVPCIESYHIIGSCNGLLCLGSTKRSRIIVMNPITPQPVLFPINLYVQVISWNFGFDESSKLFKVIVMTIGPSLMKLAVSVCDLGSGGSTNWRSIGETPYDASRLTVPDVRWTIDYRSRIPRMLH